MQRTPTHLGCITVKVHPGLLGFTWAWRLLLQYPLPPQPAALAQRRWGCAVFLVMLQNVPSQHRHKIKPQRQSWYSSQKMLKGETKTVSGISTHNPCCGCGRHNRVCNAVFWLFSLLGSLVHSALRGMPSISTAGLLGACRLLEETGVSARRACQPRFRVRQGHTFCWSRPFWTVVVNRSERPEEASKKHITTDSKKPPFT